MGTADTRKARSRERAGGHCVYWGTPARSAGATVTVLWQHVSSGVAADGNGIFTFCAAPTGTSGLVRATLGERGSEAMEILLRQGTAVAVATVVLSDPSGR